MADQCMLRGVEFSNCDCTYGCGCQFKAPSTNGFCEAMGSGHIEKGYFNDTRLDGFNYVMLLQWPGEIAQGNGAQQILIDAQADALQREALRKILHGEATAPGGLLLGLDGAVVCGWGDEWPLDCGNYRLCVF